jgi:hypothetical protein
MRREGPIVMSNIDNENLVEAAALQRKIDHDLSFSQEDLQRFEREIGKFNGSDFIIMSLAINLLEGKQYSISTDNPDTTNRCRSLAEHMGA